MISSTNGSLSTPARRTSLSGRTVLLIFVAFFASIFVANGILVYSALSTFSGSDGEDTYRRGLNYNETLAEAERQRQLGWTSRVQLSSGSLSLELLDRNQQPVEGRRVSGSLGRPSADRWDQQIVLKETAPGHYQAALNPVQVGSWIASLSVAGSIGASGAELFKIKERLWLKPSP
jgi:nitrogen fixation protein FixH